MRTCKFHRKAKAFAAVAPVKVTSKSFLCDEVRRGAVPVITVVKVAGCDLSLLCMA